LISFTAMRPLLGLSNGRDVSLFIKLSVKSESTDELPVRRAPCWVLSDRAAGPEKAFFEPAAGVERKGRSLQEPALEAVQWTQPHCGIGNKMRQWCDEARLPECSAHGLKKVAATIVAELGATDRQMMALFDWTSERMANTYTRKANKVRLAAAAARLFSQFSWGTKPEPNETAEEAEGVANLAKGSQPPSNPLKYIGDGRSDGVMQLQ
jgi:hypothetical protein